MSDDLTVSGGGSLVVATDGMRAQVDALRQLLSELTDISNAAHRIDEGISVRALRGIDAPYSAVLADDHTERALALLARSRWDAELLLGGLVTAISGYSLAETAGEQVAKTLAARLGHALGALSPLLVVLAAPALGSVALGVLIGGFFSRRSPAETVRALGIWMRANPDIISDPHTVALVRSATGSSDDFLAGALRIPESVSRTLGDDGLQLTGLSTAAALMALLGARTGILPETAVTVTNTGTTAVLPPMSLQDRAQRIPTPGATSGDQIRIEKFTGADGSEYFEVYIAGTVDFGVPPDEEPFDMTSNIHGVGGLPAGSVEAVKEAMAAAGVTADSQLTLTGYSQGGLVASLIAASEDYDVKELITFGSPSGLVAVPADVAMITVRHTDDIVPATGGYDASPHALVVERQLFAGETIPTEFAVPAHQLEYYRRTAALIDAAQSAVLRTALEHLDGFSAGSSSGTATTYLAKREQ